jgi:hypothetical protein
MDFIKMSIHVAIANKIHSCTDGKEFLENKILIFKDLVRDSRIELAKSSFQRLEMWK